LPETEERPRPAAPRQHRGTTSPYLCQAAPTAPARASLPQHQVDEEPEQGDHGRSSSHLGTEIKFDSSRVNRAEGDDFLWSEGRAENSDSIAPHGGNRDHRSSSESCSDATGNSHLREREGY
jgi:hypothetical protein